MIYKHNVEFAWSQSLLNLAETSKAALLGKERVSILQSWTRIFTRNYSNSCYNEVSNAKVKPGGRKYNCWLLKVNFFKVMSKLINHI